MIKFILKRSAKVPALQYTKSNLNDIIDFVGQDNCLWTANSEELLIVSLEGHIKVEVGAYVIKGTKGEFYPCREDIFKSTYYKVK